MSRPSRVFGSGFSRFSPDLSLSVWQVWGEEGDLINVGGPRGKCVFRGIFAGYMGIFSFFFMKFLRSFNNRGRWKVNRDVSDYLETFVSFFLILFYY